MKYILRKDKILAIEVLNEGVNESIIKILGTNFQDIIDNKNIHNSKNECRIVRNEIQIKKAFKKKMASKRGLLTCCSCGKKNKHLTVDHIKPLNLFGGRYKIRKDAELWKRVWDQSNLQILCCECNQIKDTMDQSQFQKYDMNKIQIKGMVLSNKKNELMAKHSTEAHKTGFGLSTSRYNKDYDLDTNILIKLARMDSRTLYPQLIFK